MSKAILQDRMDEVENLLSQISKEIIEITQLLKDNNKLEAIAAKIITDLSEKMDKCECSKEIFNYLKEKEPKDPICKEVLLTHRRHTPPNFMANPNDSIWPSGESSK